MVWVTTDWTKSCSRYLPDWPNQVGPWPFWEVRPGPMVISREPTTKPTTGLWILQSVSMTIISCHLLLSLLPSGIISVRSLIVITLPTDSGWTDKESHRHIMCIINLSCHWTICGRLMKSQVWVRLYMLLSVVDMAIPVRDWPERIAVTGMAVTMVTWIWLSVKPTVHLRMMKYMLWMKRVRMVRLWQCRSLRTSITGMVCFLLILLSSVITSISMVV